MHATCRRVFCARNGKWLFCLGVAMGATVLTYWPQGMLLFRYDRLGLSDGELWRLVSAHLVHLNAAHLFLNLIGLFLVCELLWRDLSVRHGLAMLATAAFGVNGLLWYLHPELAWYAGLSGALHGLWAGLALAVCLPISTRSSDAAQMQLPRLDSRWIGLAGLLLLGLKLILESAGGAAPRVMHMIGAPVVSIAHVYGAVAGCCYVAAWRGWSGMHRKIAATPNNHDK